MKYNSFFTEVYLRFSYTYIFIIKETHKIHKPKQNPY